MLNDRRLVDEEQEFTGQTVVQKLFNEVAPKFADRNGGYTRIIKLSDYRIGDGGSLVLLQLLAEESAPKGTARRSAGLRRKRNERVISSPPKSAQATRPKAKLLPPPRRRGPATASNGKPSVIGLPRPNSSRVRPLSCAMFT